MNQIRHLKYTIEKNLNYKLLIQIWMWQSYVIELIQQLNNLGVKFKISENKN